MGSAMNDTTRELGGALGVAVLGSLLAGQYTSGVESAAAQLPAQAREVVEGSIGGAIGLIEQGLVPAQPLLDIARESFVDGLHLAAIVGACVTVVAALIVKRYLPADRRDAQIRAKSRRHDRRRSRLTLGGDADAPGVQALREPDVRQRRHRPQVRPRPRARRAVALPRQLPEVRAPAGRRGLDARLAGRPADARRAGERRRRHGGRPARRGRGPPASRSATGSGPRSTPSRPRTTGWRRFFGRR